MLYINKITADASQQLTLTGIPGIQIGVTLRFMPRVRLWVMGITYNNFAVNGVAVVTSLNLLRQFRNIIPFGINCVSMNNLDPYQIDDFTTQNANLYLLNSVDVAAVESGWF